MQKPQHMFISDSCEVKSTKLVVLYTLDTFLGIFFIDNGHLLVFVHFVRQNLSSVKIKIYK